MYPGIPLTLPKSARLASPSPSSSFSLPFSQITPISPSKPRCERPMTSTCDINAARRRRLGTFVKSPPSGGKKGNAQRTFWSATFTLMSPSIFGSPRNSIRVAICLNSWAVGPEKTPRPIEYFSMFRPFAPAW